MSSEIEGVNDLLPCPHCGEQEHLYPGYHWPGTGEPYCIDCLGCGADFTPREGMDVIAMWNRRTNPSSIRNAALIRDLMDCLEDMTKHYQELVDSGDCGNWNSSDEIEVRAAKMVIHDARETLKAQS